MRHKPNCSAIGLILSMYSMGSWKSLSVGWKVGASNKEAALPGAGKVTGVGMGSITLGLFALLPLLLVLAWRCTGGLYNKTSALGTNIITQIHFPFV